MGKNTNQDRKRNKKSIKEPKPSKPHPSDSRPLSPEKTKLAQYDKSMDKSDKEKPDVKYHSSTKHASREGIETLQKIEAAYSNSSKRISKKPNRYSDQKLAHTGKDTAKLSSQRHTSSRKGDDGARGKDSSKNQSNEKRDAQESKSTKEKTSFEKSKSALEKSNKALEKKIDVKIMEEHKKVVRFDHKGDSQKSQDV